MARADDDRDVGMGPTLPELGTPDRLQATTVGGKPGEPRPSTATAPSVIGRFAIHRKLGEGGMGAVYLATDPTLGRRVAIKVLHRDGGPDAGAARRRLLREAQGTAQLVHEHVVVVHEVGTHDDHVFLAMEYVAGTTLKAWQLDRGWREVLAMYRRAGHGLQAAHEAGLVHRDFKPDNVLVGDDGRVRVTDFGLVASVDEELNLSQASASLRGELDLAVSMTLTGTIMGTPRYMAPEQHLGQPVDARADQFAFCVALYEAWWKQPPFIGHNYDVMVHHVLGGDVLPVPASSEVPAPLRAAVLRGLSRQRDDRFPSMKGLLAALVDPTEPIALAAPRRRRWPWLIAALVGAAVIAVLAYALLDARKRMAWDGRYKRELGENNARLSNALAEATAARDQAVKSLKTSAGPPITAVPTVEAPGAKPANVTTQPPAAARPWAVEIAPREQEAALLRFNEGNRLLADGAWAAALDKYRNALAHWDHPAIHYNSALALVNLDQPIELHGALERAMAYGAAPIDEDKFDRAKGLKRLVDKLVASVAYRGVPAGATLTIDGKDVFVGPGDYHGLVVAGAHTVGLRAGAIATRGAPIGALAGSYRWLDGDVGLGRGANADRCRDAGINSAQLRGQSSPEIASRKNFDLAAVIERHCRDDGWAEDLVRMVADQSLPISLWEQVLTPAQAAAIRPDLAATEPHVDN